MAEDSAKEVQLGRIPTESPPAYSNFVSINHGPHDFRITFGLAVIPMGGLQEGATELLPTLAADVVVPASEMPSLIEVLSQNYAKWQKAYSADDSEDSAND